MNFSTDFHGANAAYAMEIYERYCRDPYSVDEATRDYFSKAAPPPSDERPTDAGLRADHVVGTVNLAHSIRAFGHLQAQLDPLGSARPGDPSLDPASHGVNERILRRLPASLVGGPIAEKSATAWDAVEALRARYCGTIGFDYEHLHSPEERFWLRLMTETYACRAPFNPIDPVAMLERLSRVEGFETFLQRVFAGKFRFSIEGLDIMVPMLEEIVTLSLATGMKKVLVGMAHRGRLNVLAHILQKPYSELLAEFKDPIKQSGSDGEDMGYTGDVKYHSGKLRQFANGNSNGINNGATSAPGMQIWLAPNPSHLEAVNPVVEGMARAAGTSVDAPGAPRYDPLRTLPIVIHGDAAFPGQGVVAETLNFSRLAAYRTGGTVHVIANNQLGFTVEPRDSRSTLYASDLAKGFEIPILHVNADDPIACIEAARLAFDYRSRFQKDILIDLIGYRRHGHNEGDEPGFTQPRMYETITQHPTVRQIWADTLVAQGTIAPEVPAEIAAKIDAELLNEMKTLDLAKHAAPPAAPRPARGAAARVKSAVPYERLKALSDALAQRPENFSVHPKLTKVFERRAAALDNIDEPTVDWGVAELMAFGSVLEDGTAVRITGQDVERGTFSHRHAVISDVNTGQRYTPLQNLPQAKAAFEIFNSALTENAAIGFEYGYNTQEPERLVIWEAQYGDFVNGAQTMLDEFVTSARAKWGLTPSLVLMLPHAYEGQGPDHSSARLERFLQMAADKNLRIVYPTTTAQYFHVLRRQAMLLKTDPLPLIVLTPKSLLRNAAVYSKPRDLAESNWQPVIDDARARKAPEKVRRLVLCSGKVYVDVAANEKFANAEQLAVVRLEQIYPTPLDDLRAVINGYPKLEEIVWLQEEPENMGAWTYLRPLIHELVDGRIPVVYIGRPEYSSPSEGFSAWHAYNQNNIIQQVFQFEAPGESREPVKVKMG